MDSAARDFPAGDFRVSDADRDLALAELGEAFRVGRLTADEFDERAGQALGARTGKELTALLADLPVDRAPATAARGLRVLSARRVVMVSSALAAATCAAIAAMNALSSGATVGQAVSVHTVVTQGGAVIAQGGGGGPICPAATGNTCIELIQEMAARHGLIPLPVPPGSVSVSTVSVSTVSAGPGFDWAGTITPAAIAVLFVALIIFMRVTRARRA